MCPASHHLLVIFEFPICELIGVVKDSGFEPAQLYYIELLDGKINIKTELRENLKFTSATRKGDVFTCRSPSLWVLCPLLLSRK